MGILSTLRHELLDVIEWLDESHRTLVSRFPRYQNTITAFCPCRTINCTPCLIPVPAAPPPLPAPSLAIWHIAPAGQAVGPLT